MHYAPDFRSVPLIEFCCIFVGLYSKSLEALVRKGVDLSNPDSIKAALAVSSWSNSMKRVLVSAYQKYVVLNNLKRIPPKYSHTCRLPFIPLEKEIDEPIVFTGRRMSVLLQCLKETGARIGEALRIEWKDIDVEKKTVAINRPEKRGNTRVIRVSDKLIAMLSWLPKDRGNVFSSWQTAHNSFNAQRKRAAAKLNNQRILQIHFHTLRHWKATMEYHRTKDIIYVMKLLGHKNIGNTLIYTQLVEFEENDKYCTAVANNVEEARKLIEAGFEFVCTHGNSMIFRKRK